MDEILVLCILIYLMLGVWFMLSTASRLDSKLTNKWVKGDIVLAVIFLPITLFMSIVLFIVFIFTFIGDRLKFTNINKWWKSPIKKEAK